MAGWQIQIIQTTTITSNRCGLHLKMGLLVQSSHFLCDLTSWLEYRLPHCFSFVFSSANCSGHVCVYTWVCIHLCVYVSADTHTLSSKQEQTWTAPVPVYIYTLSCLAKSQSRLSSMFLCCQIVSNNKNGQK